MRSIRVSLPGSVTTFGRILNKSSLALSCLQRDTQASLSQGLTRVARSFLVGQNRVFFTLPSSVCLLVGLGRGKSRAVLWAPSQNASKTVKHSRDARPLSVHSSILSSLIAHAKAGPQTCQIGWPVWKGRQGERGIVACPWGGLNRLPVNEGLLTRLLVSAIDAVTRCLPYIANGLLQ
ncbi:uncharacterized protein LY79DRAFT_128824 [Colletotrichum navitas]|uniref:Uncharacterized protein n=1 Tax=Colletotrichum navitas TaxID=681940 RepID=A0AAD8V5C5_9PEZI|nr:uncharacterized protein LY79DRAFT_128824 [Colletotrichum navitas]KAK1594872.1 hypothetical protein LY79DRAFT_128824 [Colletotrichum navitas]